MRAAGGHQNLSRSPGAGRMLADPVVPDRQSQRVMLPSVTESRRRFLRGCTAAAVVLATSSAHGNPAVDRGFKLSLGQRSLRRRIATGQLRHLDFVEFAKRECGIDAVDYLSVCFREQVSDDEFLAKMNRRAADQGVRQILVMVEDEGDLAAADDKARARAVDRHRRWIDAAAALGCRGVAVRVTGDGEPAEQWKRAAAALARLDQAAADRKMLVLVASEGGRVAHDGEPVAGGGGLGGDPKQLARLVRDIDSPRCAVLPMFDPAAADDPVAAAFESLMPAAKGVALITRGPLTEGSPAAEDFLRRIQAVLATGYRGYFTVEYHGDECPAEAIRSVKQLLDRFRDGTAPTAPERS
jgi:L-ribulose-5-phosphate 3-epimerase